MSSGRDKTSKYLAYLQRWIQLVNTVRCISKLKKNLLESVLELLGHAAVVFGFLHDFADEPLLAVQVIVVELFVQVLEHGDPLDDVESVVVISIIGRPL